MSKRRATLAVAGLTLGCAVPAAPAHAGAAKQDRVERAVIHEINVIRHEHGLHALHRSRALARAADRKAREIARTRVLSHASPDGTPMDARVRRYVRAREIGETIGMVSRRSRQVASIVQEWMDSPAHRAQLLSPDYKRIGAGRRKGRLGLSRVAFFTLDLASAR